MSIETSILVSTTAGLMGGALTAVLEIHTDALGQLAQQVVNAGETFAFALRELLAVLVDAWEDADLWRRLRSWWWVIAHREALDD